MMNEILPYVIEEYSDLADIARRAAAQDRTNKDAESWVLARLRYNSLFHLKPLIVLKPSQKASADKCDLY